jgi:hypothetical protein
MAPDHNNSRPRRVPLKRGRTYFLITREKAPMKKGKGDVLIFLPPAPEK